MLQKVEIIESGDTIFLIGEQVHIGYFNIVNNNAIQEHYRPAKSRMILQGITKASLQTNSFLWLRSSGLQPTLGHGTDPRQLTFPGLES